jgi:hypothetical protein
MFTPTAIEAILSNKYSEDFFDISFTQNKDENPVQYRGPGTIYQNEKGEIRVKLFHAAATDVGYHLSLFFGKDNLAPGKLLPKHHFYTLTINEHNRTWTAEYIYLDNDLHVSDDGVLIDTKINKISIIEKRQFIKGGQNFATAHVLGKYSLPANKEKVTKYCSSISITTLDINKVKYEIEEEENHIEIHAELEYKDNPLEEIKIFLEALSIALGKHLVPVILTGGNKDTFTTSIYSQKNTSKHRKLEQPLPRFIIHNPESLNEFISKYSITITRPLSIIYRYWHRLFSSSDDSFENRDLIITTAVEGLLKELYKELGLPDKEFCEYIDEAKNIITSSSLEINKRALSRITSSLNNALLFSPKQALNSLQDLNIIKKVHLVIWKKTRNKSHHAEIMGEDVDKTEKSYYQILTCLELFYILIFYHINYKGKFIRYSLDGWPDVFFDPEKGIIQHLDKDQ